MSSKNNFKLWYLNYTYVQKKIDLPLSCSHEGLYIAVGFKCVIIFKNYMVLIFMVKVCIFIMYRVFNRRFKFYRLLSIGGMCFL